MKRPIYYDTETTGLRPSQDRIIELAAYDPLQEKTLAELINPGIPVPEETTAIHGITDGMLTGAPTFAEVAERFNAFCSGDVVLIAHNNEKFDQPFLYYEYCRAGALFPSWSMIDSLKWARKYRPDLPRHTLQFLREVYNIEPNKAHRALNDVFILHQVFNAMIDDLPLETVLQLLK